MSHNPFYLNFIVVIGSGLGCFPVAQADDVADKQDTAEIEEAFDEFNAAFRHLDWERLRKTFANDATMRPAACSAHWARLTPHR